MSRPGFVTIAVNHLRTVSTTAETCQQMTVSNHRFSAPSLPSASEPDSKRDRADADTDEPHFEPSFELPSELEPDHNWLAVNPEVVDDSWNGQHVCVDDETPWYNDRRRILQQAGVIGRLASGHVTSMYSAARSAVGHALQASKPAISALFDVSVQSDIMQSYRPQDAGPLTSDRVTGEAESTADISAPP